MARVSLAVGMAHGKHFTGFAGNLRGRSKSFCSAVNLKSQRGSEVKFISPVDPEDRFGLFDALQRWLAVQEPKGCKPVPHGGKCNGCGCGCGLRLSVVLPWPLARAPRSSAPSGGYGASGLRILPPLACPTCLGPHATTGGDLLIIPNTAMHR